MTSGTAPAQREPAVQVVHDDDVVRFARGRYLDLLLAAPKSVSILLAGSMSGGQQDRAFHVRMAHTVGIEAAFRYLQKEAGYASDQGRWWEVTLQLHALDHLGAERDAGDPHLHTHLILAVSAPSADGRALPVDRDAVCRCAPGMWAMYDATLAQQLQAATPAVMTTRPGAQRREVAGIEDKVLAAFPGESCRLGLEQVVVTHDPRSS